MHDAALIGCGKVLVVGGAGYIGSVLCRTLLRAGYTVVSYDRLLYSGYPDALSKHPRFVSILADTRDMAALGAAMDGCQFVVYLAELVGDPICRAFPTAAFEINAVAPAAAVRMANKLGISRLIYFSSCSVYGASNNPDELLTENSAVNPQSDYGHYKISVEQAIRELNNPGFSILRLGTVFGYSPRMRFDLVVNQMTARAVVTRVVDVYGGSQWRPHAHVNDVVDAVLLALEAPADKLAGQIFNVLTDNLRILDLGVLIAEHFNIDLKICEQEVDSRNYRADGTLARRLLGFAPHQTLLSGIEDIAAALRDGRVADFRDARYSNVSWYRGG